MNKICPETLSDMIVKVCPLGCNETCARIWTNKTIDHRIICKCSCGHNKKGTALVEVAEPETNTERATFPPKEETPR